MVIITTVGTSLLTNLLNETELRKCFGKKIAVRKKDSISNGKATINELEENNDLIRKFITGSDKSCLFAKDDTYKINLNASAEIKSICKIANGQQATVYLLTTDTDMSEFAAEKIKEALNGLNGLRVEDINKIKDLSIDNPDKFQQVGFINLINAIDDIYNKHKKDDIILNISGGYKALIPFLTIYGQIRNLSLMYIYEDSDELIEINNKILGFDYSSIDILYPYMEEKFYNKKDKNKTEQKIFEELKNRKLIFCNENEKWQETAIGYLFKLAYDRYSENSKKPFSFLMEYKLWEFFNKNGLNGVKYKVKHECTLKHKDINNNQSEKPDLCFYDEDNNLKIIGEIKSFAEAKKDKVKTSAIRRISIAKKRGWKLDRYILFIYKAPYHNMEDLKEILNNIKNEIKQNTEFNNFEVKYFDIKTYRDEFAYNFQGFLQSDKLEINSFTLS